jgi:hypothetical protein
VDAAGQYRHLIALGREEFLSTAAPAAFVRYPSRLVPGLASGDRTMTIDESLDETMAPPTRFSERAIALEIYPLVKKPGASFADRITIGRTPNNDVVINDHSVSRLHAYVRRQPTGWVVADAGSKNGSWMSGEALEPRRELPLPSKMLLRLGEVDLTFYVANDLFEALGGY